MSGSIQNYESSANDSLLRTMGFGSRNTFSGGEIHSATEGKRSQIEKGKESRNHGRKQARVRKSHEQAQQFGVDGEVREQRQEEQ